MTQSYSKTVIVGRLGADPQSHMTPQGTELTRFPMAVSRKTNKGEETTWFSVTTFGKTAKFCADYLGKGASVLVEGRLVPDLATGSPKIWHTKSGEARTSYELYASEIQALDKKDDNA